MLILTALGEGSVPLTPDIIPGSTVHEICANSPIREMQIGTTLTFHISSIKGVFVELIWKGLPYSEVIEIFPMVSSGIFMAVFYTLKSLSQLNCILVGKIRSNFLFPDSHLVDPTLLVHFLAHCFEMPLPFPHKKILIYFFCCEFKDKKF